MVSSIDLAAAYADSGVAEVLEQLDRELIGLTPVKTRIREIAALLLVDQARQQLHSGFRELFAPAAVCFAEALYLRLKPLFGSIEKFDTEGIADYATKLEALMDPHPDYDHLWRALLEPARDAEHVVANIIYELNETRHDGEAFEAAAHRLVRSRCPSLHARLRSMPVAESCEHSQRPSHWRRVQESAAARSK